MFASESIKDSKEESSTSRVSSAKYDEMVGRVVENKGLL